MPSTTQPELTLTPAPPQTPDVRWLEALLLGANCWMSARDIELTTGGQVNDRNARKLASVSEVIISGDKGYKHADHATPEELAHSSNRLISQGKQMIKRGLRIRRYAHRRIG